MKPYYEADGVTIWHGDCLDVLRLLPDASVDAVVTDPPYYKAINEPWDKQWDTADGFTTWLKQVAEGWHRVLRPNGTLYCFASPQMAARVELLALESAGFHVFNRVVWHKMTQVIYRGNRDSLTQFHSGDNERLLIGQPVKRDHDGQDALRAWENAQHRLRAQVFEPLRVYLADERDRAGFTDREIDAALGCNGMAGHWFGSSQWALPSKDRYEQLRRLFNGENPLEYLRRDYEDLRRDYEDLRRDYEDLRRPFDLGDEHPNRPRGEVWRYAPVGRHEKGHDAHPCEKPQMMLEHIIATSTRPGAVVLDTFMGSGSTGVAAARLGRSFIGVEMSQRWVDAAVSWVSSAVEFEQVALW